MTHTFCLAFLQNMWVRDPKRLRRLISERGDDFRIQMMRRLLFYKSRTGRNLTKAFGDTMEFVVFEETTREIAGDSRTVLPANRDHIIRALMMHRPLVVMTFGESAHAAVCPIWKGVHIHAHHPASRHKTSQATLIDAADRLKHLISLRNFELSNTKF